MASYHLARIEEKIDIIIEAPPAPQAMSRLVKRLKDAKQAVKHQRASRINEKNDFGVF